MSPEDIGKALDEIGKRIGPYGEAAWGVLVKQTFTEGIVFSIIGAVALITTLVATVIGVRIMLRMYRKDVEQNHRYADMTPYAIFGTLGATMAIFLVVILTGNLASQLLKLLNPEYYALTRLLEALP